MCSNILIEFLKFLANQMSDFSLVSAQSLCTNFITISLSPSEEKNVLEQISQTPKEHSQEVFDFCVKFWKYFPLHQEGLRLIRIASVLQGYDATKAVDVLFEALNVIDKSKKEKQFLAGCKLVSKILTVQDLMKSKPTLPKYIVASFMKINDQEILTKLAEEFSDCLTKNVSIKMPSFRYAKIFAKHLPKDIYIKCVIGRFEKQLLRGAESFLAVCAYSLPEYDLSVNEKSVGYALLSQIASKGPKTEAGKLLQKCAKCFNTDELFKASIQVFTKTKVFDSKLALSKVISTFDSSKLSDEMLKDFFNLIKNESQSELQTNLILALSKKANQALDHFKELKISQANIGSICSVLLNSSKDSEVIEFLKPYYNVSPSDVARVILRKGVQELSSEEIKLLNEQKKNVNYKYEALLLSKQIEDCLNLFISGISQYTPIVLALQPKVVAPLLKELVHSSSISNQDLLKFEHMVLNSKESFDKLTISIFSPKETTEDLVPSLIELIPIRKEHAGKALSFVGFTKEQYNYVKNTFENYFNDPLSQDDIDFLYLGKESEVYEAHPTAQKYNEAKEEIAHPNAKTDLPKLKKQIEKLREKTISQQKQTRENLFKTYVSPVMDCLVLLISHFENKKTPIKSSLTTFTNYLLRLFNISIFTEIAEKCLISSIKCINLFKDIPRTILRILLMDPENIDEDLLNYLVPQRKLTDTLLHLISNDLHLLLKSDKSELLCDVEAITPETDVTLLLPIYLKYSNLNQKIFEFAVSMCVDVSVSQLSVAFDYLLDNSKDIRTCALSCIFVSNYDIPVTPMDICIFFIHSISNSMGSELLEKLEVKGLDNNETLESFTKLFYTNTKDESLLHDIGTAFGILMEDSVDIAIKFLMEHYMKNKEKTEVYNVPLQNNVRLAISYAFLQLKSMKQESIDFIATITLKDSVEQVRQNMTELCKYFIDSTDKDNLSYLFNLFFGPLDLPPVASLENNRLRVCLVNLCYKIVEINNSYTEQFLNALMNYNIRSPDDDLRDLTAKTISKLAKKNQSLIPSLMEKLLESRTTLENKTEKLLGFAYAYSALTHAQGVGSLKKDVFDFTDELSKSNKDTDRQIACFIFSGLSCLFGAIIEPSLPRILPVLLLLFGDKYDSVRNAAEKAIQGITKNLTRACVERVLPYALEKVESDDSWRIQYTAILLVKSVIKSSPRNIGKFIPNIVSALGKAIKSAASQVRNSALETIDMLRSSITNEAVSEIFQFLVNAISNPSTLEIALEKISHLNLVQKLDNSSLSLIIPILINGCSSSKMSVRTDSFKVLGNLPLISKDGALTQFSDILIEPLLSGISDPSPNLRAVAGNSLAALVPCFEEGKYEQIMNKLLSELKQQKTFAERQGSSQAIAMLIKARGIEQLNQQLHHFVDLAQNSEQLTVREGYISLLGFLSHFFGEEFIDAYNITITAVLDACADPNDTIRTVGLRSASLIAKTFSKSNPQLILKPFFSCALKQDWRQRLCAVNFMKSFVYATTNTTEADDKGIREIGELLKNLELQVTKEILFPALMTLFVLSADPVPTVSNEAQLCWRQLIPNTGQFLRESMNLLLERIKAFTTSEFEVVRTVGAAAMVLGVRKLKTRFLNMCFDSLDEQLCDPNINCVHGAVLCIHLLLDLLTQEDKIRACKMIAVHLSSTSSLIRFEAMDTFMEMRESIGEEGAKHISTDLIKYVYNKAEEGGDVLSLSGLLSIIGHHAMVELSKRILQRPLDEKRIEIASSLVFAAGEALDPIMPQFAERLISMSAHPPTEEEGQLAIRVAFGVIDSLNTSRREIFTSKLVENMRNQQPQNRKAATIIGGYLLKKECCEYNQIVSLLVRASLYLFDDPLDDIQIDAIQAIRGVGENININDVPSLIKEVCETLESICSVSDVRGFTKPESFEALDLLIEAAFQTKDQSAIESACTTIATVVPQLSEAPISTRKLIAKCVYQIQVFSQPLVQLKILKASRALFEKATSERQMLVNSLPVAYIRLFRNGNLSIQTAASDALCSLAKKISTPTLIIRCLLQIIKTQEQNTSSTVLNAIITIVKGIKLTEEETDEYIPIVSKMLKNNKQAMRDLTAQTIAAILLSSTPEKLISIAKNSELLQTSELQLPTTLIVYDEIIKNGKQDAVSLILPFIKDSIPKITDTNHSNYVKNYLPKIYVSMMIRNPELIDSMLSDLLEILNPEHCNENVEKQVITCQELHRFMVLKLQSKEKLLILNSLTQAFINSAPAVQFAAARTIFDCFRFDELDENKLITLAKNTEYPQDNYEAFKKIIEVVNTDRANQKLIR